MISVIIPHFQRVDLLRQTLDSLAAQTERDWEAIVVDDGSSQHDWDAVRAMASDRVTVLLRTDGVKGPSRCRNLGWQAARGDLILFLDSDDLLGPDCLRQRRQVAEQLSTNDFWVFPVELFRENPGDLGLPWNQLSAAGEVLPRFLKGDGPWCVSSACWTKSALRRIGGFNEAVMYGDDADLHIRALLAGLRFVQLSDRKADIFIRRSDVPRITGTVTGLSDPLLQSRVVRLTQGTVAIVQAGADPRLLRLWQSQYFMEAEFLLFNVPDSSRRLRSLIQQWRMDFPQEGWRIMLTATYLGWCEFWRSRWYLQVRLARRIVMCVLPECWFPRRRPVGAG